jgi:hypothetical protein
MFGVQRADLQLHRGELPLVVEHLDGARPRQRVDLIFNGGFVNVEPKSEAHKVRAVRGGL